MPRRKDIANPERAYTRLPEGTKARLARRALADGTDVCGLLRRYTLRMLARDEAAARNLGAGR